MRVQEQIEQERPLMEQARQLAIRHQKPFTIWRDGANAYLRCSTPQTDTEAHKNGWEWMSVTYPPAAQPCASTKTPGSCPA